MRLPVTLGLLLAAGAAHAQRPAPADSVGPLSRNLYSTSYGFGLSTVSADDDYYLPNDDVKFGSEVSITYTHFFSKSSQFPTYGIRTGLGLLGRAGNYQFFGPYQGQKVRRAESLLTVPLELVVRRPWATNPRFYSSVALGGYFGELLGRTSFVLDPSTGKTQRNTDSWLYATGGVSFDLSLGYQSTRHHYHALGVRLSGDVFKPKSPDQGGLPNLRQTNVTLYYSLITGF